jgi:hypothetical protein
MEPNIYLVVNLIFVIGSLEKNGAALIVRLLR